METRLSKIQELPENPNQVLLSDKETDFSKQGFSEKEINYIKSRIEKDEKQILINRYDYIYFIEIIDNNKAFYIQLENARKAAFKTLTSINSHKIEDIYVIDLVAQPQIYLAYAEGLALSNYQFTKYFKEPHLKQNSLKSIFLFGDNISDKEIDLLNTTICAVYHSRNLINEPNCYLTATQLSEEISKMGVDAGYNVEVLNKTQIEVLRMGGLLAVNKGSCDPPTFTILEWKPENAMNQNPIVLIGKGIVFDTGGLSLKPTKDSMDYMKSDMAGAAAVAGCMYVLAKTKMPVYVIGLIPATDNRPGMNAYVPGDIIKMHNGLSVEVLNCDAEGRLILADALSYAQNYNPQLVIDIATLTGSAQKAIGIHAGVVMGTADDKTFEQLKLSADYTYERIVQFPLWEEYDKALKSEIADLKNVGGDSAGAITAGKFLERFTSYPWIHFDIAGTAFFNSVEHYKGKGGTGYGIRLLIDFIKRTIESSKN